MSNTNPYQLLNTIILIVFTAAILWAMVKSLLGRKNIKHLSIPVEVHEAVVIPVKGIHTPFCRLKEKHTHLRITLSVPFEDEKHTISFHYCPTTHRIRIIKPHPLTPDQVKYGEDYEEKANHYGE